MCPKFYKKYIIFRPQLAFINQGIKKKTYYKRIMIYCIVYLVADVEKQKSFREHAPLTYIYVLVC